MINVVWWLDHLTFSETSVVAHILTLDALYLHLLQNLEFLVQPAY